MIVSHARRFIFIKTRKVGGTSVEAFLSRHCGERDIVTPVDPPVPGHLPRNADGYRNHMPAVEVRDRVGRAAWDDYFTFSIERNPWDKVVSHFHMLRTRAEPDLAFDAFVRSRRFPRNLPLYTDGGTVIVDRVLRYESLATDLGEVFASLAIPFDGDLGVRAKGDYRPDRRPYREYYTPAQADIVADFFRDEIRMHGYVF